MRLSRFITAFASLIAISSAAFADNHNAPPQTPASPPKLVIAISVDQFSSDLFNEYRSTFTGGLKRLAGGAVFPAGYQGHAATETCPGHSTIMTGASPARTGIIANRWIDLGTGREDKNIYCAEDENIAGSSSRDYTASPVHLLVPTLGERLKKISPKSLNIAVSGKDRAAIMMGGTDTDEIYFWDKDRFVTLKGRPVSPRVAAYNERGLADLALARPSISVPAQCAPRDRATALKDGKTVGTYKFERPVNGASIFRASPDFDLATLGLALEMVDLHQMGQRGVTDILSVGLSATDYVGHSFGTAGVEMCINLSELDRNLGEVFDVLDKSGIDYMVMLTADHGGLDLPERMSEQAVPSAERVDPDLNDKKLSEMVAAVLNKTFDEQIIFSDGPFGDFYVSRDLSESDRAQVQQAAMGILRVHPQVHSVLSGAAISEMPMPSGPVDEWTMAERTRASYHKGRSGDFIVLLKKTVTPIANTSRGYVATHGSPWDYDRGVPILFWGKNIEHFEQPIPVQTVDIAPTLASLIGVTIPAEETDGRCLDIDSGPGDNCAKVN